MLPETMSVEEPIVMIGCTLFAVAIFVWLLAYPFLPENSRWVFPPTQKRSKCTKDKTPSHPGYL